MPTQPYRLALFWRLLGYLFLFIVVNLLANVARVGAQALGIPPAIGRLVFTLLYIGGVLGLTYAYRRFIDRRPWQGIALPALSQHLPDVARGILCGMLLVAIVLGIEYAAHWILVVGIISGASALTLLFDSLFLSLAFGVCEEICFRGYLFQNLGEGRPLWQATLITGVIFGAFHLLSVGLGARGLSFFLFIMVLNVFLVLTRLLTGSLWMAIGFHTAFDWLATNLGLGAVVLADRHLLQIERTVSLISEDLLSMFVVGLGILLCIGWAWRSQRRFTWPALLAEDGQPGRLG